MDSGFHLLTGIYYLRYRNTRFEAMLKGQVMGLKGQVMGLKGQVMRLKRQVMGLKGQVMGLKGLEA